MKSFKEVRENMRGFAIGPMDTMKTQASLGGSQFFPNKKYAVTMPAMSASYKGGSSSSNHFRSSDATTKTTFLAYFSR